jgi:hypothetical protein
VIIDNLNLESVTAIEPETNPPLAVDADTPLPVTVARQFFQLVGWGHPQILNPQGRIQLRQAHHRPLQNLARQAARLAAGKEDFRFRIGEGLYHPFNHKQIVYENQGALIALTN